MAKYGRNKPCWCGSGKKYKKCHYPAGPEDLAPPSEAQALQTALRRSEVEERIRKAQQGEGRPLVSADFAGHKIVATGNKLYWSKSWKTFADFLFDYIKKVLGPEWGNREIREEEKGRHTIIQWYQQLCALQAKQPKDSEGLHSTQMNGCVICYLGLAYNLYLIKHNVELQERLVARLKDHQQFQGAYYELIVANCLIRAGFELELEDESDQDTRHCEFSAKSKETGERFWVEAKMRSVDGLMGKSKADSAKRGDPTTQLTRHLGEALSKPAPDRRMIFIDINGEPQTEDRKPVWGSQAIRRLEGKEQNLKTGEEAYVFITNFSFHRALDEVRVGCAALAYGLGIPDFGKTGKIRLMDWYKNKQKHWDAYNVMDAVQRYPQIPDTFDGKPSSEALGKTVGGRLLKGETYFFEDAGENGTLGTVQSIAVNENAGTAMVVIGTPSGKSIILDVPLSHEEVADYRKYGRAFFGETDNSGKQVNNIFEFYEWLINCHKDTSKPRLLELAEGHPDIERLKKLDRQNLILEICESQAVAAPMFDVDGKK